MVDNDLNKMNSFINNNNNEDDDNSINYKYTSREEIINWIYELNPDERTKAFSITNNKLTGLIQRMYTKFSLNSKTKFKLTFDNDFYNIDSLKQFQAKNDNELSVNEEKMAEKLFLKEIRFYTIKETYDTITLAPETFLDKRMFVYYFDLFSKKKFFSTMSKVTFERKDNFFKCKYPSWFKIKEYYSLPEIIIAHFEVILNIKYFCSNKKYSLNNQNELYDNFFDRKKIVKEYLDNLSKDNNTIGKNIQLNNIINEVFDIIEKKPKENKSPSKYFLKTNNSSFQLFNPDEEVEVKKKVLYEKYMNRLGIDRDDKVVDEFMFCSFFDLNSCEYEIEQRIINELYKLGYEKYLEDFIDEFSQENEKNNKRKKKKKKGKKGNKNSQEEEKKESINNEIIKSNNNNLQEKDKIIIEETKVSDIKIEDTKQKNHIKENNHIEEKEKNENEKSITIKEDTKNEDTTNEDTKNEDIKNEDIKNEDIKNEDIKNEDIKNEDIKNEDIKNNKKEQKQKKTEIQIIKDFKLTQKEIKQIKSNFFNNNNFKSINIKSIQNPKKTEKLHNLILTSITQMTNSLISIKDLKYNNLLYLCQKIKECFQCEISIDIYGSYSTGMEIESSDIDISINLMNEEKMKNTPKENLINDLNNFLSNDSIFENLFPITATSVPILKLVINQHNIKTKVDLTFDLENPKIIINYYTNILKKNPEIKPLTLIIKKLISKNHLNRVFEGGLSSHSIFIMVASNIKLLKSNNNNNKLNLGELLLDLLRFYGLVFNYTNTIIDITKNNPYVITQEFSKIPIFLDPISNINISKSSYQFDKVKDLFYNTYTMLVQNENDIEGVFEKQFGKI